MNAWRARTWSWFAVIAVLLGGVMVWLTTTLLAADRNETEARRQAAVHEKLRLALWRMDSWWAPQLAREAVRPAGEYQPFAPAPVAWTQGFHRLGADQVLTTSNLVGRRLPLIELHFEIGVDGTLSSPQAPTGNARDVCEANGIAGAVLDTASARLDALRPRLASVALRQGMQTAERELRVLSACVMAPEDQVSQVQQSAAEYNNRQQLAVGNAIRANIDTQALLAPPATVGPLVPFWLDGEGADGAILVFARSVADAGSKVARVQGFVVDWPSLQVELRKQVEGLFAADEVTLVRCDAPTVEQQATMLASVPVRLCAQPRVAVAAGLPMGAILWAAWGLTALALGALAFNLRAAIGYGERRARFASAVTHELRTPLTTFRMYSEMLAEGMVTDPAAQREYLGTLQRESDRLARVVENVLAWSRLEDGRFTSRRSAHRVGDLLDGVTPVLERRLGEAGLALRLTAADALRDASVVTDADAVGQILFNLVDNAAKYAAAANERTVELQVAADDDAVTIAVHDHGPGIAAEFRERVFAPFDRGAVPSGDNDTPGVGLGLPLARGLARDLGGDLVLDAHGGDGARFVLRLPRA